MTDFPSNSHKAKTAEPRERIEPVTTAKTGRRKRGLGGQFKDAFIAGTGRDALSYMVEDVVVPTIRDMFVDALQGGIDRLFHGDTRTTRRRYASGPVSSSYATNVNYAGMSTNASQPARTLSRQSRARHEFDELIIPSMQEANEVIDRMFELLSRHGSVSVADLFELTGVQSSHTDMKWGWTNLRGAKAVKRGRQGGFVLDLPRPEELYH